MKGIFTQGLVVLTRGSVSLEELGALLKTHPFVRTVPANDTWAPGGSGGLVAYRTEVNGAVLVDIVERPWPDHMGDPKGEPTLFAAWTMGNFGPLTYPRALDRATQQSWSWADAKTEVPRHTGFIRLRLSYVFGAGPDAKVMPADCNPRHELEFLTALAVELLQHPAALCYFNPNGEVVLPAARVTENLAYHREHKLPPLNLWANVRLFNVTDDWLMMDSVGNAQLDLPDMEVAFPKGAHKPGEIDYFIRNATLYLITNGAGVIKNGDTMNGPGDTRLQATTYEHGISDPPRRVLCWVPEGAKNVPKPISDRPVDTTAAKAPVKKPWWKPW